MYETTLLKFKIKNTYLAGAMNTLPVNITMDKAGNYAASTRSKDGWYSEGCLHLDLPQGSLARWFYDILKHPHGNGFANLYQYKSGKEKYISRVDQEGFEFYDKATLAWEIEIRNIRWSEEGDWSNYLYQKRTETEITTIKLTAEEWVKKSPKESLGEALAGDASKIRQYAKTIGNVHVESYGSEDDKVEEKNEPVVATQLPYDASLAKPEDWTYKKVKAGTICLTAYNGTDEAVYVPESIDGKIVTELSSELFTDYAMIDRKYVRTRFIKHVILPDTVEILRSYAFGSVRLESIRLSQNLKEIGLCAFRYVKVKTIEVPASVTKIGGGSFAGSIETIIFRGNPTISKGTRVFPRPSPGETLTVYTPKGSNVEEYCRKTGVTVVAL